MADDLYFIRIDDGPCKIGRSTNIPNRLKMLRTHSPYPVRLIGEVKGAGPMEKVWHYAFLPLRLEGEWFRWSFALEAAIDAASAGQEWIATLSPPAHFLWRARRDWGDAWRNIYSGPAQMAEHRWRDHVADKEEAVLCR